MTGSCQNGSPQLLLFLVFSAAVAYLYEHPSIIASWVEDYLSNSTGLAFDVENLSYSVDPMRVQTGAVRVHAVSQPDAFSLSLDRLSARMHLEGHLGGRSLIVDMVDAKGLIIEADSFLPSIKPRPSQPDSFFTRMQRRLISVLLFDKVRFDEMNLSGERIDLR